MESGSPPVTQSPTSVAQRFGAILPLPEVRRPSLELLADLIELAHAQGTECWCLTLRKSEQRLALNVGQLQVLGCGPSEFLVGLDDAELSTAARQRLAEVGSLYADRRKVPGLVHWILSPAAMAEARALIEPAMRSFVVKAAAAVRQTIYRSAHSPEALVQLQNEVGRPLPAPSYRDGSRGERMSELAGLFEECRTSYFASADGRVMLEAYARSRSTARPNLERLRTAQAAGQDVTEDVLRLLLPHNDFEVNRARGAWVHVAPAVKKDVRQWFEGAGWVRTEDWPKVAAALLEFVVTCVNRPADLAVACERLAALPFVKGMQSGMLSPILNALVPERFLIINGKSLQVIGAAVGAKTSSALSEYPELNALGLELLAGLPAIAAEARQGGILPCDLFDHFCHWLVAIKKWQGLKPDAGYWKISPGAQASEWAECVAGGYIAMGWPEIGDVARMSRPQFQEQVQRVLSEHPDWKSNALEQIWKFSRIGEGAILVANRGTSEVVGIGRTTGPYYFAAGDPRPHRLPVEWYDRTVRAVDQPGWRKTLIELDPKGFAAIEAAPGREPSSLADSVAPIAELGPSATPAVPVGPGRQPPYSLADLARDTGFDAVRIEGWLRLLRRKQQIVLQGPPGTGKTFLAERLARHLVGDTTGFTETVQFHPGYAYEDFIEGIRPEVHGGALSYGREDGRFLEFCSRAEQRKSAPCVLVIDEINRANLPRVLGELLYLLEYRQAEIPLAGGRRFRIPDNVFLIGTMNTADRAIARLDYALRRRFAFIRLQPEYDVLHRQLVARGLPADALVRLLREVNTAIDDPNYQLGISYFLPGAGDLREHLQEVWQTEIESYLEEFFYDQPKRVEALRWQVVRERFTSWG